MSSDDEYLQLVSLFNNICDRHNIPKPLADVKDIIGKKVTDIIINAGSGGYGLVFEDNTALILDIKQGGYYWNEYFHPVIVKGDAVKSFNEQASYYLRQLATASINCSNDSPKQRYSEAYKEYLLEAAARIEKQKQDRRYNEFLKLRAEFEPESIGKFRESKEVQQE